MCVNVSVVTSEGNESLRGFVDGARDDDARGCARASERERERERARERVFCVCSFGSTRARASERRRARVNDIRGGPSSVMASGTPKSERRRSRRASAVRDAVASAGRRSTRSKTQREMSGDGNGSGTSEEATETFTFTPVAAMRSLENVELSADRRVADAATGGKRARRGTPVREAKKAEAATEERRVSKTFWAPESARGKATTFAPLAHSNGLPPTPAVYSAVPWPSSIPIREQSPVVRASTTVYDESRNACFTPDGHRAEQPKLDATNISAGFPPLLMKPLAKTPKELATQLVEVKREIAKRQSDAMEVSRVLRQLQREEADLYARAAEIQRHLLESTSDGQPYDLNVSPMITAGGVQKIVALDETLDVNVEPRRDAQQALVEDAEPSTSEAVVNSMQPFQRLDVRKSVISVDFIDGPGGLSLFTASADDCLRVWAPDSRKPAALMRAPRGLSATTIVDERIVCAGTKTGQIFQMDLVTGQQISALTQGEHAAPWSVNALAKVGHDSDMLIAAAGAGGDIKIWDARLARNAAPPMVMYAHGAREILDLSFSSNGRTVVAAAGKDLRVFDVRMSGRSVRLQPPGDRAPSWTTVNHDASTSEIISTCTDGDIHVWSADAPHAHARTLRRACAPDSAAVTVTPGAVLCASGVHTSAIDVLHHASGDVIARWRSADTLVAPACVAASAVGARDHPYGVGSLALGALDGTVLVFA